MTRPLAEVRLDQHATCRYLLVVEGLPYAWTNDESGALLGSGLGSWIGRAETAIGGSETLGTREVRPGLIIDDLELTFAIADIKTGELQPNPTTFRILDPMLATLFASDQLTSIVAERIAPGIAALPNTIDVDGGGTETLWGRYAGLERFGAAGQRRTCPAIPVAQLVGFDHAVGPGLPPVLISDTPVTFAGRMICLYRVYFDSTAPGIGGVIGGTPDYTSAYSWEECYAAGDLLFVGVMRDAGFVGENEVVSIEAHSWDALLRRTLNVLTDPSWIRITGELALTDEQRLCAITFAGRNEGGDPLLLGGVSCNASVFDTGNVITGTDRGTIATQLNGWIAAAIVSTTVGVGGITDLGTSAFGGGAFTALTQSGSPAALNPTAGITSEGIVWVQREPATAVSSDEFYGEMCLALHGDVWRALGFDPARQTDLPLEDFAHVRFERLVAGEVLLTHKLFSDEVVPADGYWLGVFTTVTVGFPTSDVSEYANNGNAREHYPINTSEVFVLSASGNQDVSLQAEPAYYEGQLTAGREDASTVGGTPTNRSRYFALRGELSTVEDDPDTDETVTKPVPLRQVVAASWVEGLQYGTVDVGDGFEPTLHIESLCDPRPFGFDHKKRTQGWAGKIVGKGGIEIAPLAAYHYMLAEGVEYADTLMQQILLSTGACAGYDDATDAGGTIDAGPNTWPGAPLFAGDYELADLGLGIPFQLVAEPEVWRAAFETVPGGFGGELNRLRLGYIGPTQSLDILGSIMRPRLLAWSLAGKRIGAFRVAPVSPEECDLVITEDDLVGELGDPLSARPAQTMRATGQLDGVELGTRWEPETAKCVEEFKAKALDADARRRTGELIEKIEDHGLMPSFGDSAITGVSWDAWRGQFRQLWQHDAADFFSRRHYALEFTLARPLGQDAMPGTSIAITNPWPVDTDGSRGINGATGRIISATHNIAAGTTRVTAIVFVGPRMVHYSPVVRVRSITGNVVEFYPDHLGHGTSALDGLGFAEPSWSDTGGAAELTMFQRNGDTWTSVGRSDVVSVDLTARTATVVSGASFTWLRDKDHYLVLSAYADQDADSWTREVYGVIADTDNTIGDGSTPAPGFVG